MKRAILAACALALLASATLAQNAPLSGLEPRGTPQSTDLIPVLPAGAPRLESMTVGDLAGLINAGLGTGSVTTVTCGTGLSGGTFTVSGTCALAANGVALGDIATIGANTVLGNFTGATADVAAQAMPSCADTAGQHLNYVSGSGFACGTSVAPSGGVAPNLLKFGPPTYLTTAESPGGYYDPQPAGLINITDNFASTGTFTQENQNGTPSFAAASNVGTVTFSSGASAALFMEASDTSLLAPQFFNAIEVTAQTPSTGYSNIYVGACYSRLNYVAGYYDAVGHKIHSEYQYSGTNENASLMSITLTPPYWIGVSLINDSLSVFYRTAATGPWLYAGSASTSANFDYTVTANFASVGFKTCFLTSWDGVGSVSVANLQGGRFGGMALRDLKPVVNPDWTTYRPGSSTIYFNASVVDPSGTSDSLGMFTLNRATQQITQTGAICTERTVSSVPHTYCADNAANVIHHANGDEEALISSWANGKSNSTPVQVLYEYLTDGAQPDILTNNLTVLSSLTTLTLPFGSSGAIGAYDPAMAYDAANSRYLMAYTACVDCTFGLSSYSNFFPALAYASTPTGTWTPIGIDQNLVGNWEGTSFFNENGALYELAGGPARVAFPSEYQCTVSRIYDENFTFDGTIQGATFNSALGTSVPYSCSHPTLFQDPDGVHTDLLTWVGENVSAGGGQALGQPVIEVSTP